MPITMVEERFFDYWAVFPGTYGSRNLNYIARCVNDNVLFDESGASISSLSRFAPPRGSRLTIRASLFCRAIRRLAETPVRQRVNLRGQGYFVRRTEDGIIYVTACGERRAFNLNDLLDLVEWIEAPEPGD